MARVFLPNVVQPPQIKRPKWNVADRTNTTLSNMDLTAVQTVGGGVRATVNHTGGGKYYFELLVTANSGQAPMIGVTSPAWSFGSSLILAPGAWGICSGSVGNVYTSSPSAASLISGIAIGNGDIIGIATDLINGTLVAYLNGTPLSPGRSDVPTALAMVPTLSSASAGVGSTSTVRFAPGSWSYAPPAGFVPW